MVNTNEPEKERVEDSPQKGKKRRTIAKLLRSHSLHSNHSASSNTSKGTAKEPSTPTRKSRSRSSSLINRSDWNSNKTGNDSPLKPIDASSGVNIATDHDHGNSHGHDQVHSNGTHEHYRSPLVPMIKEPSNGSLNSNEFEREAQIKNLDSDAIFTSQISSRSRSTQHESNDSLSSSAHRKSSDQTHSMPSNLSSSGRNEDSGIFSTLLSVIRPNEKNHSSSNLEDSPQDITDSPDDNIDNLTKDKTIGNEELNDSKSGSSHTLHNNSSTGQGGGGGNFVSKLEFLLKPAKAKSSSKSLPHGAESKDGSDSPKTETTKHNDISNELADIHFESIRESPLQTLGSGNLSLAAFDNRKPATTDEDDRKSISRNPSIKKVSVSRNQSQDNILEVPKRPLSPEMISRGRRSKSQQRISKSFASPSRSITEDAYENEGPHLSAEETTFPNIENGNIKYASDKRNEGFHSRFKEIPSTERLIDDYSCAMSKDILIHGRIYISDSYICFDSNILGWVTNTIIPLQEVIQIEKKSTAVVFPNAMVVRTLHQKHVFATMISRDNIFSLITEVWHRALLGKTEMEKYKIRSPSASSDKEEGVFFGGRSRSGSKREDYSAPGSDSDNEDLSMKSLNDDDRDDSDGEADSSDEDLVNDDNQTDTKNSKNGSSSQDKKNKSDANKNGTFHGLPYVGPATHEPTDNGYSKEANDTFICEEIISCPVGVVYNLMFGEDTQKYVTILKDGKNFDITEDSITPLSTKNKERKYAYTKPLGGAIGPKQTRCNITDTLLSFDPDSAIVIEQVSKTPDVPNGNSFSVKTRIYLSWAENNATKFYVVTNIEWTGKSWIKGAIEKGSIDGQKESMKSLIQSLNGFLKNSSSSNGDDGKNKKKSANKRKRRSTNKQEEVPSLPPKEPQTISQQFIQLLESIGSQVPINIPYVNDSIKGGLTIFMGYLMIQSSMSVVSKFWNRNSFEITYSDGLVSKIKLYGNHYTVINPVKVKLEDEKSYKSAETAMWQWLQERGAKRKPAENYNWVSDYSKLSKNYNSQEVLDMIELTQSKLDEVYRRLL